jgi:hypothetical protein
MLCRIVPDMGDGEKHGGQQHQDEDDAAQRQGQVVDPELRRDQAGSASPSLRKILPYIRGAGVPAAG